MIIYKILSLDLYQPRCTRRLESEKFDLEFQIAMKRIFQNEPHVNSDNAQEFVEAYENALLMAYEGDKWQEFELITLSLRRVMKRMCLGRFGKMVPVDANYEKSKGFLRNVIDPRMAVNVAERNPQAALVLFQLAKELHDLEWIDYFIRRSPIHALDPRYLLDLSERNPEAALAWVQLMKESGGKRILRELDPEFFERALDPRRLMKGTTFAVLLQLARIQESSRANDLVLRYLISLMNHPIGRGFSLEMLPLTAIRDLQWLAKTTSNPEINSVLNSLLDETAS